MIRGQPRPTLFPSPTRSRPGSGTGAATAGDDTLTIATTTDVVNYNPLIGNSRSDYWITNLMYPHLLSITEDGSKEADRKSTRLNSSHANISYAVFCLKKKKQ